MSLAHPSLLLATRAGCLLAIFATWVATSHAQTRFEAEGTSTPRGIGDAVASGGVSVVLSGTASGGKYLLACDSAPRIRILFRGTGIDVLADVDDTTGVFDWNLNDGVQSGTVDTRAGTPSAQTRFALLAPASLPDTLHTLEIQARPGACVRIDAFDVHDSAPRRRSEAETPFVLRFSDGWVRSVSTDGATAEASNGFVAEASNGGRTAQLFFSGRAVALLVPARPTARALHWDIDGKHSGLIRPANVTSSGTWHRWPFILKADLPDGPHTLTIRTSEGTLAGIDAFDVLSSSSPAALPGPYWATTRGMMTFTSRTYTYPWNAREWSLSQWETWFDQLAFLGMNQVMIPRAPWSERPAQTSGEIEWEDHWRRVLAAAQARGLKTNVIFGSTFYGDTLFEWRLLSPNNPSHPQWQQLNASYQHFGQRYGTLVDEWSTGVEDPGGCPVCASLSYPYVTITAQCSAANPVCTVGDLVGLQTALHSAVTAHNPNAKVIAQTWGLQWFGRASGYATHEAEFLATQSSLPSGVILDTPALTTAQITTLQGTGREVRSWPFFLIDHEFPAGNTRLFFNYTRDYLNRIRNAGVTAVTPHVTHPIEQLPALYVYSRLLQSPNRSRESILTEFAAHLVSSPADQTRLVTAITNLGLWCEATQVINNWDPNVLYPVNAAPPHSRRYSTLTVSRLQTAHDNIIAITSIRETATMPMLVTPAEWIEMLREQIRLVYGAAVLDTGIAQQGPWLDANHAAAAALPEGMPRATAEAFVADFQQSLLASPVIHSYDTYLARFWPYTAGLNQPMGIIYDYLKTNIPQARQLPVHFAGDVFAYKAPSHPPLFKATSGITEENSGNFSFELGDTAWDSVFDPQKYSGGSAMLSRTTNAAATIIFSGTGVSLVHPIWPEGGTASWSIDGGAGGSGVVNLNGATTQHQVVTPLADGLANTLHTLRIQRTSAQANRLVLLDGIHVQNPSRLRQEENTPPLTTTGAWGWFDDPLASRRRVMYTTQNGATVTIPFDGTAVALVFSRRADYGSLSWSIDGGAGGSGTLSQAGNFSPAFPVVLARGLADGPHTLTLNKTSGFLVSIDAVDSSVNAEQAPIDPQIDSWFIQ
jgi:hypothetical protein